MDIETSYYNFFNNLIYFKGIKPSAFYKKAGVGTGELSSSPSSSFGWWNSPNGTQQSSKRKSTLIHAHEECM